jgi:hypothetical protein
MKLIVIYIVSLLVCIALSALGYWLGGHSFAERGKDLMQWYIVTMMFSALLAGLPAILYEEIKDGR